MINSTTSITVQRGWWFSAHEQWKYMMLPYIDIPINQRVFYNGERARSWWSAMNKIPGLFASVNGLSPNDTFNYPYVSDCGIQEIAFENVTNKQVITPYGVFPMLLATPTPPLPEGLVWYWNMISGPRMQNCFGSTEAANITGYDISPVITWDSKITTVRRMHIDCLVGLVVVLLGLSRTFVVVVVMLLCFTHHVHACIGSGTSRWNS